MNPPPLLELDDLRVWYPIRRGLMARTVGHVRAVDGVTLRIAPGETLGLVGESGCGKSTLARAVLRLEPVRSGAIRFEGIDMTRLRGQALRAKRRELQIVFQDPYASLNPRMTVQDLVTEGLITHGMIAARERADEARRLLTEVGLGADALHRYPHEFSGGQRQRISVARALALRPRLVICDEPVSALDVSVQAQVLNLLRDLAERHGLAYLFISHDLSVVRQIADRTAVMYLGRIVEEGPTDRILDAPAHPYTQALISAIPRPTGIPRQRMLLRGDVPSPSRPPSGCAFHPRCPRAIPACAAALPPTISASPTPGHRAACIRLEAVHHRTGTDRMTADQRGLA